MLESTSDFYAMTIGCWFVGSWRMPNDPTEHKLPISVTRDSSMLSLHFVPQAGYPGVNYDIYRRNVSQEKYFSTRVIHTYPGSQEYTRLVCLTDRMDDVIFCLNAEDLEGGYLSEIPTRYGTVFFI